MSLLGKIGGVLGGAGAGVIGKAITGGIAGATGGGGIKGALLGAGKGILGMGSGATTKTPSTDISGKPRAGEKPPLAMNASPASARGTSAPIAKKHVSPSRSFSGRRR